MVCGWPPTSPVEHPQECLSGVTGWDGSGVFLMELWEGGLETN